MKGTVLDFSLQNSLGVISGSDGKRYKFIPSNWLNDKPPSQGMKVDFDISEDGQAVDIYPDLDASSPFSDTFKSGANTFFSEISQKLGQLTKSGVGVRFKSLFSEGLHNRIGFIFSLITLASLFTPILDIPFVGEYRIMDEGVGKTLFNLLIVLSIFFYGGISRLYVKILCGVIIGLLFVRYYDLYSLLSQLNNLSKTIFDTAGVNNAPNVFTILRWGILFNIISCLVLYFASFKNVYRTNDKTF